jgi:Tol biopolymer transport system component
MLDSWFSDMALLAMLLYILSKPHHEAQVKFIGYIFLIACTLSPASSQLRITKTEKLPLPKTNEWSSPTFSPNGKLIYVTTSSFNGIWEFNPETRKQRHIVADPASGYNFSLSPDGKSIAYRRTRADGANRIQEVVVKELATGAMQVIGTGDNLSAPVFAGPAVVYNDNVQAKNITALAPSAKPFVLAIENTKIAVVVGGAKRLLDPLGNGSYIWAETSPDGSRLVASEMARGTIVASLEGSVLAQLGKRNAATWTRNGKWLVYMNDKDDGHTITSSDLFCISPNGRTVRQLTFTKNTIELNPKCSPTESKIVCNSLDGEILLMTYVETGK